MKTLALVGTAVAGLIGGVAVAGSRRDKITVENCTSIEQYLDMFISRFSTELALSYNLRSVPVYCTNKLDEALFVSGIKSSDSISNDMKHIDNEDSIKDVNKYICFNSQSYMRSYGTTKSAKAAMCIDFIAQCMTNSASYELPFEAYRREAKRIYVKLMKSIF